MLKSFKKLALCSSLIFCAITFVGCSLVNDGKRIVRISHGQSTSHPQHLGLMAFEKYIEENLPQYDIQIFPNELLGPSVRAIELVQTGAIDFVVSSTSNLETFNDIYQIFSMPYLFDSVEAYHSVMENEEILEPIYSSTEESGFKAVTWFDAGTRNFYATTPINTPDDLKGKKIRVIASPTNIKMMEAFGAAATPMSFGEVYTAIQQGVIQGAENNELALTNNKHGEIAKYYSYNQHQMVPDMLVGNSKFLNSLPEEESKIFEEAAKICTEVEIEAWKEGIEQAKEEASKNMGVQFIYPEIEPFKEKLLPLHKEILAENPKLEPIYNNIQKVNKQVKEDNK
ncbi:TRAP transporter substrate-binding protein [[Clostridium] colinum]|uniref:TRAP transporter substrate-binding protein n=1 Tax=[Clostridium] colinum TaxID=36835 RepID=UPI002023D2E9|nr:TRAP transporter substrate-binding protein [[Clostridium] colinum]